MEPPLVTLPITVCITSFNTAGKLYGKGHWFGKDIDVDFIDEVLRGNDNVPLWKHDVLVFCLQESHMSFNLWNIVKRSLSGDIGQYGENGDDILQDIHMELKHYGFTLFKYQDEPGYGKEWRRGLRLAVFSKIPDIKLTAHDFVPCVNYESTSGKGMIAMEMLVDGMRVSFTNAHLPFEAKKESQGLQERTECMKLAGTSIVDADVEFLIGDLNFRTTRPGGEEGRRNDAWKTYQRPTDELGRLMGNAGDINRWLEIDPTYGPTCSLTSNRTQNEMTPANFDWYKGKEENAVTKRTPSYCDRILYRIRNGTYNVENIGMRRVDAGNIKYSDHAVVQASFMLRRNAPSPVRHVPSDPRTSLEATGLFSKRPTNVVVSEVVPASRLKETEPVPRSIASSLQNDITASKDCRQKGGVYCSKCYLPCPEKNGYYSYSNEACRPRSEICPPSSRKGRSDPLQNGKITQQQEILQINAKDTKDRELLAARRQALEKDDEDDDDEDDDDRDEFKAVAPVRRPISTTTSNVLITPSSQKETEPVPRSMASSLQNDITASKDCRQKGGVYCSKCYLPCPEKKGYYSYSDEACRPRSEICPPSSRKGRSTLLKNEETTHQKNINIGTMNMKNIELPRQVPKDNDEDDEWDA